MRKLLFLFIISLFTFTSCSPTLYNVDKYHKSRKVKKNRGFYEKKNLMILDQIYHKRNEKYFKQNLRKKYGKHKRSYRRKK